MQVRKVMKYSLSEAERIALNTALDIIDKVAENFGETTTFDYTDFDTAADTINTIIESDNEDLLD
jgi:predicted transglutaminase-like protease